MVGGRMDAALRSHFWTLEQAIQKAAPGEKRCLWRPQRRLLTLLPVRATIQRLPLSCGPASLPAAPDFRGGDPQQEGRGIPWPGACPGAPLVVTMEM